MLSYLRRTALVTAVSLVAMAALAVPASADPPPITRCVIWGEYVICVNG